MMPDITRPLPLSVERHGGIEVVSQISLLSYGQELSSQPGFTTSQRSDCHNGLSGGQEITYALFTRPRAAWSVTSVCLCAAIAYKSEYPAE